MIGAGRDPVNRGEPERSEARHVYAAPPATRDASHRQRGDFHRDEQIHGHDAKRHGYRLPRARERDEKVGRPERRVRVGHKSEQMQSRERDRECTEEPVQVQ